MLVQAWVLMMYVLEYVPLLESYACPSLCAAAVAFAADPALAACRAADFEISCSPGMAASFLR